MNFTRGATLYMEVDFKDIGGTGNFGTQYNAVGNDFQFAGFAVNNSILDTGTYKTAVFRLDNADLHYAENGGTDLRLTRPGPLQLHIVQVRVSDSDSCPARVRTWRPCGC